jgi:hypothetical protein
MWEYSLDISSNSWLELSPSTYATLADGASAALETAHSHDPQ